MPRLLVTIVVLSILFASLSLHAQTPAANPAPDRQYFRDIAAHQFAVPSGASAFALAQQLTPWLASPDPTLRDDLAYTILDQWIRHGQLTGPQLLTLLPQLQQNLTSGIGESGTDAVLKRSFSALTLASFAERDLEQPFLSPRAGRRARPAHREKLSMQHPHVPSAAYPAVPHARPSRPARLRALVLRAQQLAAV